MLPCTERICYRAPLWHKRASIATPWSGSRTRSGPGWFDPVPLLSVKMRPRLSKYKPGCSIDWQRLAEQALQADHHQKELAIAVSTNKSSSLDTTTSSSSSNGGNTNNSTKETSSDAKTSTSPLSSQTEGKKDDASCPESVRKVSTSLQTIQNGKF